MQRNALYKLNVPVGSGSEAFTIDAVKSTAVVDEYVLRICPATLYPSKFKAALFRDGPADNHASELLIGTISDMFLVFHAIMSSHIQYHRIKRELLVVLNLLVHYKYHHYLM